MRRGSFWFAAVAVMAVGCAMGGAEDDDRTRSPGPTGSGPAPAMAGAWVLPADVREAGERQTGSYEGAGPWRGREGCESEPLPGTRALAERVASMFPGSTFGGFSCEENPDDTAVMSMHGTGRAVDILVPMTATGPSSALGDPVANYLVTNATRLGVQYIVWNRTKWNVSYTGCKDAPHTGSSPHTDHIHVELGVEAAMRTPDMPGEPPPSGEPPPGMPPSGDPPASGEPPPSEPPPSGEPPPGEPPAGEPPPGEPPPGEPPPSPPPGPVCMDTCAQAFDDWCDDGGPGADTGLCPYGTDCWDCGPRP